MKIVSDDKINQELWDGFVTTQAKDFGFLQSWDWGEFQKSLGRKIIRLAIEDGGGIVAVALLIKHNLFLGKSYLYSPRGPLVVSSAAKDFIFLEIKNISSAEGAIFYRFDPAVIAASAAEFIPAGAKFVGQVQPKQTLILDLQKTAEETLAQMKSKTRYNIKLAQKQEITIVSGREYFDDFWELTKKTAARDRFVSHPKSYYEKMIAASDRLELLAAKYKDKIIAANLIVFFGQWAVYLHGASDYAYREKMAPYFLQWSAIEEAQKRGARYYDFWGVDENKWPGVTRFKEGFAPQTPFTEYTGAWDIINSGFWYLLYRLVKKIKR